MALGQGRKRKLQIRTAGILLACAPVLALVAGSALGNHNDPPPTEASCRYLEAGAAGPADNKLEISLGSEEGLEIERVGERIRVNSQDYSLHREIPCAFGVPTVTNTDSIVLVPPSSDPNLEEVYYDVALSIDLTDGLLAPGATPEADGPEIELTMAGKAVFFGSELTIITTPGEDQVRSLTTFEGTQINLNATEATPDADIELPPVLFGAIYAGEGDDVVISTSKIRSRTPYGFGLSVIAEGGDDLVKATSASGGKGDDTLVGGPYRDFFIGGEGSDTMRGKNERDFMTSAGGRDLLLGGGGGDVLLSLDGDGDRTRCGDGRDRATVDRRDKHSGCERLRRVKGGRRGNGIVIPDRLRLRTRSGKPIPTG